MGLRRDTKKKKIIEELRLNPIVTVVCKRINVSTASYYRWRIEDYNFAKAADIAQEQGACIVNDAIESKLISLAMEGNPILIMYWLNNRHRNYYLQRAPHPPSHIEQLEAALEEKYNQFEDLIREFTDDPKNNPFYEENEKTS